MPVSTWSRRPRSADDLLLKIASYQPDVAIIDIRMPPTHTDEGLRAAEEIRRRYPDVGILILSQHVEVGIATRLLSESAAGIGYLLKDRVTNLDDFTAALRRVAEGGSALDPQVVSQMLTKGRSADDPLNRLTPREREVLELVAEGRSNKGIGERLVITERAVQKHVTSIFMKLGLPTERRRSPAHPRRARLRGRRGCASAWVETGVRRTHRPQPDPLPDSHPGGSLPRRVRAAQAERRTPMTSMNRNADA